MGLSLRKIGNSIRDVFDANTADDYKRREQAQIKANPTVAPVRQTYAQEQIAKGIGRVSNNVGARTINAGKSLWEGFKEAPEYIGKGLSYGSSQQQSTDQSIISQQNQRTQELARARTRLKDPTLTPAQRSNYGKFVSTFGSDQDKRNAQTEQMTQRNVAGTDPVRGAGYVASMGFDVITGGVGGGAGATLKAGAKQGIKQFAKQAIIEGAKSGAVGAGSGALQAIGQKGTDVTLKDIGQGAVVGGTIGAVLPVASYGAGRVISKVKPRVGRVISEAVESTDPANDLVKQLDGYKRQFDVEVNPTRRKQISQGMADLSAQIRETRAQYNQGGYVKNPLANDAPQVPGVNKESLKLYRGTNDVNASKASPDRPIYHADTPEYAGTYGKVSSKEVTGGVLNADGIHAYDRINGDLRKAIAKYLPTDEWKKLSGNEQAEIQSWVNHTLEGERLSSQFNKPMPEVVKKAFNDMGIDYIRIPGDQFKGTVGKIGHQTEIIEIPKPKPSVAIKQIDAPQGKTETPKTVKVFIKSKFRDGGGYADVPVIRKEENITLYQGTNAGDNRQFWTPNKKYAGQFGEVKEKTGTFYQIDNGNRMTDVYVEAPSTPAPQVGKTDSGDFKKGEKVGFAGILSPQGKERTGTFVRQVDKHLAEIDYGDHTELNHVNNLYKLDDTAPQVGKTVDGLGEIPPKPKVAVKTAERVSSIDPTDPFGNKNIIKKVRNELGSLVDDDAQMLNMLRKIEKQTGQKGLVDQWYFDSGNVRQSTSIANAKLKNSADLDTALSGLSKKDLDGLDNYTAARAELKNYDGMKTSKMSDDLAKIVAEGDAQYGERFGALNSYYKNMAQDMKDAGLIDESTLKKYLESDDYVRIQRDMEELVNGQYGGSGSRSIGSTSAKQKRTGSTREVVAPTKSLLKRTQQIELEIQRNKASTNIINVLEENGLATRVKDPKSKNVVSRIVDGKKETFEVPGDIKKVIENVNPYQLGIIARVVSTPSRLLRAGTTALSAPFALTNYARDQASSAMVSKSARNTHTLKNIAAGLGSAIRDTVDESHSPLWKKFEAFAGDSTVFDELRNAKSSDRMLRELTQGRVGKYKNMVTAPVRTLEDLNGITEKATRFQNFKGMYEKVLKETGDEQKAIQQAVLAARQNSVDFGRNSSFTRVMNLVFPYFNASIQGSRTVARSFRDRPVATGVKTAVMGSAVLGITAYNMSDEKRREAYNSINDFEKEDNFIIVGPDAVQNDNGSWEGVYKIPKPQGFREIVDPISDMAQAYFNGESVEDTTTMLTDMLSAFTGPIDTSSQTAFIGSLTPQAIKPSVELAMNKSLYTGKDIVPQFMEDGTDDPTKRAFKSTSGSAQWIADQLGVSPIQVEAFIKGTGGSLGLYGLNASDNILAKTGKISEENIGGRSALGDIKRRTLEASGEKLDRNKSAGQKYFEGVNIVKEPLRGGDKAAFDTLHQSKTNFLGEEIFDENKRITKYTRAGIYLNNPNVLDADVKLDAIQRQNGNPGNPLFDLPKPLLTKVLLKDALPPGAKDPELSNLYKEEWYQDYQNERSKWYEGIKGKLEAEGKTMPKSTNPYPTTPKPLQKAMDAYSALPKGTGERSGWIKANPGLWQQMTAQWAQVDAWENNERVAIGLAPIVEDPNATSKYGSGGGKKSDPSLNPLKYAVSTKSTAKGPTISLRTGGAGRRVTLKAPTGAPKVSTKKSLV